MSRGSALVAPGTVCVSSTRLLTRTTYETLNIRCLVTCSGKRIGTSDSVRRDSSRCTALATPIDLAPPPLPPGCLRTPRSLAGHSFGLTVVDQSQQHDTVAELRSAMGHIVKAKGIHDELAPHDEAA